MQELRQNINQILDPQNTLHSSTVRGERENNRVITLGHVFTDKRLSQKTYLTPLGNQRKNQATSVSYIHMQQNRP